MNVNQWGAVNQWQPSESYSVAVSSFNYFYEVNNLINLTLERLLTVSPYQYNYSDYSNLGLLINKTIGVVDFDYSYSLEDINISVSSISNNYNIVVGNFQYSYDEVDDVLLNVGRYIPINSYNYTNSFNFISINYSMESTYRIDTYTLYYKNEKPFNIRYYS